MSLIAAVSPQSAVNPGYPLPTAPVAFLQGFLLPLFSPCLPTSGYPGLVNGDNVGWGGKSVVLFSCVVDFGAVLLLGILLF